MKAKTLKSLVRYPNTHIFEVVVRWTPSEWCTMHDVEWYGVCMCSVYLWDNGCLKPAALDAVHVVVGELVVGRKILAGRCGRPTKKYKSASPLPRNPLTHTRGDGMGGVYSYGKGVR